MIIPRYFPIFALGEKMENRVSELLKNLNEAQREAVVNYNAPSLIVAGAGSGKTRVLTSRIAYMLQQGVPPYTILALTFTNKAAEEMRERIATMVSPEQSRRLWMGTFHSMFLRILRFESDKLGYPQSFTIYDTAASRNLIKTIVKEKNLNDENYKPAAIQARISLAKNNLVTPEQYEADAVLVMEDRKRKMPELIEVYKEYMRRCKANAAMDFDDMLLNINILFRDFPDVLAKYQQRFQYILVDEYQDTNYAQYIIIRRLAAAHNNVCVVGDDAQSIYSFRGAKIENILRFRNDFPDAKMFKLEQNYRSTRTIVNAANSVIEKNKNRLPKESFSKGMVGEKIKVLRAYTDQEEASMVADEIRNRVRESGANWSDVALLYRTNMQSRVFEEAFRRRGIPYKIHGGHSFYQRKEIKDVLAYMQLIVNPRDDEAFKRVINYPSRGIGDVTIGKIATAALAAGTSMWTAALGDLSAAGLNAGTSAKVRAFTEMISSLSQQLDTLGLYQFGMEVATRSGIIGAYRAERTPEAQSALDNIEELLNSMQVFSEQELNEPSYDHITGEELPAPETPSLTDWLQSITLLTDADEDKPEDRDKVTLMTIHAAKGLEYRFVFIVGLEENLFPSQMSMDGGSGLEEERRLFYVALTRAKEAAVLSYSESRFKWGSMEFCRPSRFLGEINPEWLDVDFVLDTPSEDSPAATVRKNYAAHNAPKAEYGGRPQYGRRPQQERPTERYTPPATTPQVGDGTRFRSVGQRVKDNAQDINTAAAASSASTYSQGQRVAHAKFGQGTIEAVEQISGDTKITVNFDSAGRKTLLGQYAKLEIVQ
jgi:DNA helicase-2/ATP-dependent DNA helicase PcrA